MAIPDNVRANFETLQHAFANGDVCLMECTDRITGGLAYLICGVAHEEEEVVLVPFAVMHEENLQDMYDPPASSEGQKVEVLQGKEIAEKESE